MLMSTAIYDGYIVSICEWTERLWGSIRERREAETWSVVRNTWA